MKQDQNDSQIKESSTDCQLLSLERLGWQRRLFEQTPLAPPAEPTEQLRATNTRHTPSSGVSTALEVQQNTRSGVLARSLSVQLAPLASLA